MENTKDRVGTLVQRVHLEQRKLRLTLHIWYFYNGGIYVIYIYIHPSIYLVKQIRIYG